LRDHGGKIEGARVALQGYGNVGSHAAAQLAERGARIVAVGDHAGGVSRQDGLDVRALTAWVSKNRTVAGFEGGDAFDSKEVLTWDCDILVPAALGGVLTGENAGEVRAQIVIEGANGPTTPEADAILNRRGITVVPDILANAGGVTVSYFEWAQNIQQFRWDLDRVRSELEKTMRKAYRDVREVAQQKQTDLRTAAFVLAIQRVGRAALSRRYLSKPIDLG
jgi:glutamate dehydrogenase (NAD(P)+)